MSKERLVNPELNAVVLARLQGSGPTTITAFSSAYDHEFPSALDGVGGCNMLIALMVLLVAMP